MNSLDRTPDSPPGNTDSAKWPASILMRLKPTALAALAAVGMLGGLSLFQKHSNDAHATAENPARCASTERITSYRNPWLPPDVSGENRIQLCQVLSPADPHPIPAIDCTRDPDQCGQLWNGLGPVLGFQEYAQGEYVGRARLAHVPSYRLRVDDVLDFVFRVTRSEIPTPYEINVGDELTVESAIDLNLRRSLVVLPD
jgi:hypothetical protein